MEQALISTIGLFWRADDVFWGRPGPGGDGSILGVNAKKRSLRPIDFREQEGIYVLYADYRVVYIGQTTENQGLHKRLQQHRTDDLAGRWDRFSWFGLKKWNAKSNTLGISPAKRTVATQALLDHMEGILIHAMEPPLNRQQGRFGESIIRFLQVRDDRLGPSRDEMIEELWKNMNTEK